MKILFLGSGDAFGSGGRLQTSILMSDSQSSFLIDFGASGMIGLRKFEVDPNQISHIFLTHLHGDHFGGIPFFLLDAQLISKRTAPLTIVGPFGTRKRILQAMELFFPGSSSIKQKFEWNIFELPVGEKYFWNDLHVQSHLASHPSGAEATMLSVHWKDKKIAYTGDSEWVDSLSTGISNSDLLIGEAYYLEKNVKFHLNYRVLSEKAKELKVKRLVLTHMSDDMLRSLKEVECESAFDGKEILID